MLLDEKLLDEKSLDEMQLDEKLLDEKPLDEVQLDEKQLDEKRLDEKRLDEKWLDEKRLDEKPVGEGRRPSGAAMDARGLNLDANVSTQDREITAVDVLLRLEINQRWILLALDASVNHCGSMWGAKFPMEKERREN